MEIDEALAKIKTYEAIVDKYVIRENIKEGKTLGTYDLIRSACLEAIAILEGDEDKFKECFEAAKKDNNDLGWGYDFTDRDVQKSANYVKLLARLM